MNMSLKEKINIELKRYIEKNILPEYKLNDDGHNIEHIKFVLTRAFELAKQYEISYDMLYTAVCFHDIACHINREEHEKLSAERLEADEILKNFFDKNQLQIMKEAIEDHRASANNIPRNIYGKILSSADRKISVEDYIKSSVGYCIKHEPDLNEDELIEKSYKFAIKKFGKSGYAVDKMFVKDEKYEDFLSEIQYLIEHKEKFIERAKQILNF